MIIRSLLAASAVALISSGAIAADLRGKSLKDDDAPAGVRVQNWSGVYGGIGCGVSTTTIGTDGDKGGISTNGQTCDARLGLDLARGPLVIGGFVNYGLTNEALEVHFGSSGATILEKDDQWDVNARIGFAVDNGLFYGHGGYGQTSFSSPVFGGGDLDIDLWQAGVGIEYAVAPNWTIALEYTHAWLDLDSIDGAKGIEDVLDAENDKVMLRTNYKINGYTFGF